MAVGDINSTAKGSGARFNDGKVPMELVTCRMLVDFYGNTKTAPNDEYERVLEALSAIADFEERAPDCFHSLTFALERLLPGKDIERWRPMIDVLSYGATKYKSYNWAKGMQWSVVLACIKRHAIAIFEDEQTDGESGCSHRGHVACNVFFLMHYWHHYEEGDDRADANCFSGHLVHNLEPIIAEPVSHEAPSRLAISG